MPNTDLPIYAMQMPRLISAIVRRRRYKSFSAEFNLPYSLV